MTEDELARLEESIRLAPPAPWYLHETGGDEDDCPQIEALWTLTTTLDCDDALTPGDLLYFGMPDVWQLTGEQLTRMRNTVTAIQAAQRAVPALLAEVRRLRALLTDLADVEPLALDQNQRPYCLSCGVNARWNDRTDGWAVDHYADCPWTLARAALWPAHRKGATMGDDFWLGLARKAWERQNLTAPRALYGLYMHGDWDGSFEIAYPSLHAAMLAAHADAMQRGGPHSPQWVYDGTRVYTWEDDDLDGYWAAHGLPLPE